MNNRNSKLGLAGVILLVAMLVACGKVPATQHYALTFTPSAGASSPLPGSQLGVAVPHASHVLRQDRIVYYTSPHEMNYYEYHRWSDSPPYLVQGLLMREMQASGLFDNVVQYRAQKGLDYVLQGHLQSMEEVDNGSEVGVRFGLELELVRQEDGHVVWSDQHACERSVGQKNLDAVVQTMSGCVQDSLDALSRSLAQAAPGIKAAESASPGND